MSGVEAERTRAMPDAAPDPLPDPDDLPDFLRFTPVPVKARHDGWTAARQRRFVVELARGCGVDEAARLAGRSRQTAYLLRRRSGAAAFAAAWDAALAFADEARAAAAGQVPGAGLGALLVPRFYRGRLIGFVSREDRTGLLATLARLDRIADRVEAR
jgi:hypothetical protein